MMELDEIHSYVSNKNYTHGFDKDSKEYIDLVVGNKGTQTRTKVEKQSTGIVVTNYWRVYNEIIPQEKLVQTRAETYTVENYNAIIRHILADSEEKPNTILKVLK